MDALFRTRKDERFLERAKHGEADFPFRFYRENVWEFDFHRIDWHWHPETEIVYTEKGNIICCVGTKKFVLRQGCGMVVNSGVLHRYEATENVSFPNIVFSPELLGAKDGRIYREYIKPVAESGMPYIVLGRSVDWQSEILDLLLHIFELQGSESRCEIQTVASLLMIWRQLFLHTAPDHTNGLNDKGRSARLQVMMQFIHANFDKQIGLKDIAASVHISESSALQLFRQGIRLSPVAYLIRYRLKRAADLLTGTNKTVTDIAYETGFSDAGYFCRTFRRYYGRTALQYRKDRSPDMAADE